MLYQHMLSQHMLSQHMLSQHMLYSAYVILSILYPSICYTQHLICSAYFILSICYTQHLSQSANAMLSIMTLSMLGLISNVHSVKFYSLHYAECHMLNVIILLVFMLNFMAPHFFTWPGGGRTVAVHSPHYPRGEV
jgi:hypothetical protein